jgi:hypothetical protein
MPYTASPAASNWRNDYTCSKCFKVKLIDVYAVSPGTDIDLVAILHVTTCITHIQKQRRDIIVQIPMRHP